ncbi:MAG: hypothetical protein FJ145_07215 [Deltaproteobacteria bacterium]|nr:hypothetical protein [Deltaproteobacteria bacterium]
MAWLESIRFIFTQKRGAKQIVSKYTRNTNDVDLEEAWNTLATQTDVPPYVSITQLEGQTNMMAEDQPDLAKFEAKTMVDKSVIKKLEDSGWTKKLFAK